MDESALLQRYIKWIYHIVHSYWKKGQFKIDYSIVEDLINEACVVFLDTCREFELESYELTALQKGILKNKICSALRVYIWKSCNMGGYNNPNIDFNRCLTVSDVDVKEAGVENLMLMKVYDDPSYVEIQPYIDTLSPLQKDILLLLIRHKSVMDIAKEVNVKYSCVRSNIRTLRMKYIKYSTG